MEEHKVVKQMMREEGRELQEKKKRDDETR